MANQVEKLHKKQYFISLKDNYYDSFNNRSCRLLNRTKMQMGEISNLIFQNICNKLLTALYINKWLSTTDSIK